MALTDRIKSAFTKTQQAEITQTVTTSSDFDEVLKITKQWEGQKDPAIEKAIEREGKRNYSYYEGSYERDKMRLKLDRNHVVVNAIFSSIKSVVPFVTSKPAEPVVYPKKYDIEEEKTEESKKLALYMQEILKKVYKNTHLQELNEANAVNRYVYKIGILRYGIKDNKVYTRLVDPKNVIFDGSAKSFKDQEFMGEKIMVPVDELIERFPKHKDDFLRKVKGNHGTRIEIVEFWTNEVVVTKFDNQILEVIDNPYKNEGNTSLTYYEDAPIPYVALNVFNSGRAITDDVSEIDQSYKIQDGLNDLYRQVLDNARYNGNPLTVGLGMSGDQLEEIKKAEPGDAIILPAGGDDTVDIKYLQAAPLPGYVLDMLQRLHGQIDSIFGTQATFRGEFEGVQSGVSRDILRQQAGNSLAQLARGIERMMDDLYKGWLHMVLVFADDPEFVEAQIVPILGKKSTEEFLDLLFNSNDDGVEVTVQAGTLLPDDKLTMGEQAMELAKMGKISNELLYERIGVTNPKEEAEKLALEQTVNQIKAQELQQQAAMKMQESQMATNEASQIEAEIASLN